MAAYIVTYDLHEQGQNYNCIIKKLEAYPANWHMQRSVWVIATHDDAGTIYDDLRPCLDDNDRLFVARITDDAAWSTGYGEKVKAWLTKHL